MTLTLEQVRQTRFHLARRNGYEPVDVDNFVDKVEATLSQLSEENQTLKQQVEALGSSEPSSIFVPGDPGATDSLRAELASARGELDGVRGELQGRNEEAEQLRAELASARGELEDVRGELDGLRAELDAARGQLDAAHGELEGARGELEGTRGELGAARGEADQLRQAHAAQAAAVEEGPKGRVENIVVTSSADAAPAVTRLLQMATEQAERLVGESQVEAQRQVSEARGEAESIIDSANRKAHETLTDSRTRADRVESEARVNAERLTTDAQNRAAAVNSEADQRRTELFTALESERDQLRGRVDHLRSFEGAFRTNLTNHLQNQIKVLQDASFEPEDTPDILSEPARGSATPRLDALLGDQG